MPNETIHAKNKTENDNYIDKHKEEKVKCCKKNKKITDVDMWGFSYKYNAQAANHRKLNLRFLKFYYVVSWWSIIQRR